MQGKEANLREGKKEEEKGKLINWGDFFSSTNTKHFLPKLWGGLHRPFSWTFTVGTRASHWAGHLTSPWDPAKIQQFSLISVTEDHRGIPRLPAMPCYLLYSPFTYILSKTPSISPSLCPSLPHLSPAHWWLFNSTVRAVTRVRGQFHVSYCLSASWELHLAQAN